MPSSRGKPLSCRLPRSRAPAHQNRDGAPENQGLPDCGVPAPAISIIGVGSGRPARLPHPTSEVSVHGPDGDWSIFRRFRPSITFESDRKHGPIPFSFRAVNGYLPRTWAAMRRGMVRAQQRHATRPALHSATSTKRFSKFMTLRLGSRVFELVALRGIERGRQVSATFHDSQQCSSD